MAAAACSWHQTVHGEGTACRGMIKLQQVCSAAVPSPASAGETSGNQEQAAAGVQRVQGSDAGGSGKHSMHVQAAAGAQCSSDPWTGYCCAVLTMMPCAPR